MLETPNGCQPEVASRKVPKNRRSRAIGLKFALIKKQAARLFATAGLLGDHYFRSTFQQPIPTATISLNQIGSRP